MQPCQGLLGEKPGSRGIVDSWIYGPEVGLIGIAFDLLTLALDFTRVTRKTVPELTESR